MATRLCVKRAKLFARFPLCSVARTFCIATAEVEKHSHATGEGKKKKERDVDKVLAYEQYRENVQNTREIFRTEHEKRQAKERRRLEEINRGSFSPIEQHKKAVEDIRKYNENKEVARFVPQIGKSWEGPKECVGGGGGGGGGGGHVLCKEKILSKLISPIKV